MTIELRLPLPTVRRQLSVNRPFLPVCRYSTHLYTHGIVAAIQNATKATPDKPFFIYAAFQARSLPLHCSARINAFVRGLDIQHYRPTDRRVLVFFSVRKFPQCGASPTDHTTRRRAC